MTSDELVTLGLTIYDEYHPQQAVDEDLKTMISAFLRQYMNDYLLILPNHCLNDNFVIDATSQPNFQLFIDTIDYKGIKINIENFNKKFLKLISFRLGGWERTLFYEDVISSDNPRRKLQENKFTSGKISRPVVSIENNNGKKSLCAWGYSGGSYSIKDFHYIKAVESITDFLHLEDYLLKAYVYYILSFVFNTTQELQLAQNSLTQMQQLLSLQNIYPQMPVEFSQETTKKKNA